MEVNDYWYYDATDNRRNALKYATTAISNETLKSSYPKKYIYVMANPARNNLAFALINHQTGGHGLAAGSLYIVSRKNYGARLNVVWDDASNADDAGVTAIAPVNTSKANVDGALYTLQGVRVVAPVKGGLYIRNGKKFIAQ